MAIYFIRHTKPLIDKNLCYGQADLDVEESFEIEMEVVKNKLPDDLSDYRIISSPLQRCMKMAKALKERPDIIDERIKEISCGDWELKSWDEIGKTAIDDWIKEGVYFQFPSGESYIDLETRVKSFIEEMNFHSEDNLIVCTHGGVLRVLHHLINGIERDKVMDVHSAYGEVYQLENKRLRKISLS